MPKDTPPSRKPTAVGSKRVDAEYDARRQQPRKAHRAEVAKPVVADVSSDDDEDVKVPVMEESDLGNSSDELMEEETTDEEGEYEGDDEEDSDDFFDEEGEEEEDSTDYSDDSSVKSNIPVNFDAREMYSRHIDGVSGLIDSSIPDGENLVDRHDLGLALKAAFCTTLITVTQIEEDDASDVSVNTADPMEDEDIYGMASFVHVGSMAAKFPSCNGILTVLSRPPESHVVAEGTSPVRLLKGADSRALLMLNDHLNIVPPRITAQVHAGILEELSALANQSPVVKATQYVIFLARVQRIKQAPSDKGSKPKVKSATPTASSGLDAFDLKNYEFLRWEDEVYLKFRDARLSVPIFKFPRYVENQAEIDIPRCVVFAVPFSKMREAVATLAATAERL